MKRHAVLRYFVGEVLDALLGPRCAFCRDRVFPKDRGQHYQVVHGWAVHR